MTNENRNPIPDRSALSGASLEQKILEHSASLRVPGGLSPAEALANFRARSAEAGSARPSGVLRSLPVRLILAAASVMLLLSLGVLLPGLRQKHVVAKNGNHLEHRLPDGSVVNMNAGSRITYNARTFGTGRKLTLEGEAFFRVEKGDKFEIEAGKARILVLGTSFNVYSREDGFRVNCVTGRVRVEAEGQAEEISPGESTVMEEGKLIKRKESSMNSSSGWINGEFCYENSPLNLIFSEIERQFNLKFVVGEMKPKYFTGSFTNNDLNNALDIVCIPMGLVYEVGRNGKILIREKAR